jgi:signal transduction histidine kinase
MLLVANIALSSALGPDQGTSNPYEIFSPLLYVTYNLLFDAALLLFVVGLAGLYARRAERLGWLGRIGLFLAWVAGLAAVVSIVATFLVGARPQLSVPVVFFAQLLAIPCLVLGLVLVGVASLRATAVHAWISSLRWRWLFLILAAGFGAALISDALQIVMNREIANMPGTHVLHVLVTIPVAIWVTRKIGTSPVLYGVLIGLVSGIINQIYFHVLMDPGTLRFYEIMVILSLSVGAGWLGGVVTRSTLAEQETLYQASRAIGETSDLQEIVSAIGDHIADPQVSHVALWQDVTEDGEPMELSLLAVWMPWVARVWGPGVWRPGLRLDAARMPALASLQQQSPLVLRVRALPASERAVWEHQGIRTAVMLPLVTSSNTRLGVLMVASRSSYGIPSKLRTYLTLSAQVSLMIENLRLVEEAQQTGVSQERQRLSHEIHDTLAQGFTSIVMNLEAAEGTLHTEPESAHHYLDQARNIARESLAEARRLMWALRSDSPERSSLPETLARLAESWSEKSGIAASATVTGAPHSLTPEIEVTVLRVAQEALNNCRKHAQASQVTITLSYMNNIVTLNVQDDGVGFDPDRLRTTEPGAQSTGGFGLLGMRERVEQQRGTLLLESAPGEGSTLMVAIPVPADRRATGGTETEKAAPPLT